MIHYWKSHHFHIFRAIICIIDENSSISYWISLLFHINIFHVWNVYEWLFHDCFIHENHSWFITDTLNIWIIYDIGDETEMISYMNLSITFGCVVKSNSSGFRPIAVGDTFRRLASRLCCSALHPKLLLDLLSPYGQLGLGAKGRLETIIHTTRHLITPTKLTQKCVSLN